jgi:hypothetical protein
VRRQVLEPHHLQVGSPGHVAGDHLEPGQASAGEDAGVDGRPRCLLDLVGAVVDRDRLQQHRAVGSQQLRALGEEDAEVPPSDRLDHLDRHELVVAATQLAVVLHQHRDPVAYSGAADLLDGVIVLFARDRSRGHVAAAGRAGMKRERTPARSGLEHAIAGPEVELRAHALEPCDVRPLERHPLVLEDRTRVARRLIEHPREQFVAEVVVRG